jgi:hypothetical protein
MIFVLTALLAGQLAAPPSPPPVLSRSVMTSRLVIPDEIAPAVVPYLTCVFAQKGVDVRGTSLTPAANDVADGCTKARKEAVANSERMLRKQGGRSSAERSTFIEKTLTDLETFASASAGASPGLRAGVSAPPKAPTLPPNVPGSEKDAVKSVIKAVKAGSDLSAAFPGAITAAEVASLKRVVKCYPMNLMKQEGGYYTVVWDCGSSGALGMKVVVSGSTVASISTMEVGRRPNVR